MVIVLNQAIDIRKPIIDVLLCFRNRRGPQATTPSPHHHHNHPRSWQVPRSISDVPVLCSQVHGKYRNQPWLRP